MKVSKQDALKAFRTIKQYCDQQPEDDDPCIGCGIHEECYRYLKNYPTPIEWKIRET